MSIRLRIGFFSQIYDAREPSFSKSDSNILPLIVKRQAAGCRCHFIPLSIARAARQSK
jgi:hypothetical protein